MERATNGRREWSRSDVVDAIRRRRASGLPLSLASMKRGGHRDLSLLGAGVRQFGSWRLAVEAAGIPYDSVRAVRAWTPERVTAEIRRRYESGEGITVSAVIRADSGLRAAAVRFFGSWRSAVAAAGLDYATARAVETRSREQVIADIRAAHVAGRCLLTSAARAHTPSLYRAGVFYFGSWGAALQAAGVPLPEASRFTPDRDMLIGLIRERVRSGLPVDRSSMITLGHAVVVRAGDRWFGSWEECVAAAQAGGGSERSALVRMRICRAIRRRHEQGLMLTPAQMLHGSRRAVLLYDAARVVFGSWREAVKAAGLAGAEVSPARVWLPRDILRLIRRRRCAGQPVSAAAVRSEMPAIYAAAVHHFGSWNRALREADASGAAPVSGAGARQAGAHT